MTFCPWFYLLTIMIIIFSFPFFLMYFMWFSIHCLIGSKINQLSMHSSFPRQFLTSVTVSRVSRFHESWERNRGMPDGRTFYFVLLQPGIITCYGAPMTWGPSLIVSRMMKKLTLGISSWCFTCWCLVLTFHIA